jgi:hypothetical protein
MDSSRDASPETAELGQSRPSDAAASSSPVNDFEFSAAGSAFTEDQALALLQRSDLPAESIEELARNTSVMKSRKARIAIAAHPRAPRHISLRLIREFFTFDLMRFALLPTVAADLKRAGDEMLVKRIASITLGERISLARRSSTAVAAALLLDKESRVWQTALENSRLTEAAIVRTLVRPNVTPAFVETVCRHPKWSLRHEVRIALLRNEKTPLAHAIEFARTLPPGQLRDILHTSYLPEKVKTYLRKELELGK